MAKKGTTKKSGSKAAGAKRRKPAGIKVIHDDTPVSETPTATATATATAEAPKRSQRKPADPATKKVSLLDAAAEGLRKVGGAHNAKAIVSYLAEHKIWTSPGGKTPEATLHSAICREIKSKGAESRFTKTGRGLFAANGAGS